MSSDEPFARELTLLVQADYHRNVMLEAEEVPNKWG